MWASLTTVQRAKAIQRMKALDRWIGPEGDLDVRQAAVDAGVSVTRMYEMGKAWRTRRSLVSLGTFAAAPKTRVANYDGAIRKALGAVVDADPAGSVRKLALDVEAALRDTLADLPSYNTLRRYVERELRRRERENTAGNDLMLDCSACILTPSDSVVLTAFAILDRATQVIVGAALGDVGDSRGGYARASADALRRLGEGRFGRLRWVDRMERCEVVAGTDLDAWSPVVSRIAGTGVAANVTVATSADRFGRYLRPATRLRVGTVVLMPTHTLSGPDRPGLTRSARPTTDQEARLSVEVDEYNGEAMAGLDHGSNVPPPVELTRLLELLSQR
jgi:hypothetical protein